MGPICNGCWVCSSWSVTTHFTHDVVNNTRNSHLWDRDNPHGTVESNYQHRFYVNVWCGVIGDQLIGLHIFPQRLTGDIYANVLQDELPALLENFPLHSRRQIYYQHGEVQPRFCQVVRQYLNHKFPKWWVGRDGAELATMVTGSEPIRLPCVGLHEKYGVCTQDEHKRKYTNEFSALRETSTTLQFSVKVIGSLVTRVRNFIQAQRCEKYQQSYSSP